MAISLIAIKVFIESSLLILVFYGTLGISSLLYYHWRGLNFADSITAGMMMILLITGFMFFFIGALFISDPGSFVISDNTSELSKSINEISSNGWGLLGFGTAIIALSYSFLGNIETQRNITMIRVLLFRGKRFTKVFQESLNWKQILVISLIWLIGALIILLYNLSYNPWLSVKNAWLLIIPTGIAYFMIFFGFTCLIYAICLRYQIGVQKIVNAFRKQIIRYCIFCYLFPKRFPEIFEN